jgi:hypothetical protein
LLPGDTEGGPKHIALLIINQVARLLWLAERVQRVSRGRPGLQIMFLMMAAEATSKLFSNYKGHRDSRHHAQAFFLSICGPAQRTQLVAAFRELGPSAEAITSELYRIRCQVVHRWEYYGLKYSLRDEDARKLREIVLNGAAHAARTLVP